LAAAALVIALVVLLWWGWNQPVVREWKAEASPVPFFIAMALLPAVGMPLTPFFVLAGAAFGTHTGLVGSMAAVAVNLIVCHWVGRGALRTWVARVFSRFGYTLPSVDARREGALRLVLMVKFMPGLPGFARNYLLAMAGVPFALYFGISMVVTGIYGAALVVLGESAFHHDARHVVAAAVVIVLGAIGVVVWRRRRGVTGGYGPAPADRLASPR
jgi:uncharacterized membrane protein YdjX (TVP38/TMEM64 family)